MVSGHTESMSPQVGPVLASTDSGTARSIAAGIIVVTSMNEGVFIVKLKDGLGY